MRKLHLIGTFFGLLMIPAIVAAKPKDPPKPVTVEDVLKQIKQEVADYNAYASRNPIVLDQRSPTACKGDVRFSISSIAVSLATSTERSTTGNASAEVPLGPVTLSGSGGRSSSRKNSQTLKFKFLPAEGAKGGIGTWSNDVPIQGLTAVLANLRTSMAKASELEPCFTFPPLDKQENSIEFGFTVTRGGSGGFKLSFLFFTIGAEKKKTDQSINTITVAFKAEGSALVDK